MTLSEMIERFHKHTSSLSTDVDDASVTAYLNRAYQFTIPLDVDGEMSEQLWGLECKVGEKEYPYPSELVSSSGKTPWIESTISGKGEAAKEIPIGLQYLGHYNEPSVFRARYLVSAVSSQPNALLFYGKKVTLDVPPDDTYLIKIPVRSGPLTVLGNAGLGHETHAMAAVAAASLDFLSEIEDPGDPGTQRESALYTRYRNQLRTYSLSRPNERRPARSF